MFYEKKNCKIIKIDQIASIRYEIFMRRILTGSDMRLNLTICLKLLSRCWE